MRIKYSSGIIGLLSLILLAGCRTNDNQSTKKADQESAQKVSHQKKVAKLKAENESLKKKESTSIASSSAKVASETSIAESQSVVAESESARQASEVAVQSASQSVANSVSAQASSAAAESAAAQTEAATAGTAPAFAPDIRRTLAETFGCNVSALGSIPAETLVKIYKESAGNGEDVAGLYTRVKNQFPEIGGNIAGPDSVD